MLPRADGVGVADGDGLAGGQGADAVRHNAVSRPVTAPTQLRISGGSAAGGAGPVDEDRMLELEREAFLSLCGEPKSQERMQYMLMNNKPLRN